MKRLLIVGALVLSACGATSGTNPGGKPTISGVTPSALPPASASTTNLPLGRSGAAMAYDETRHDVVLFGGFSGQAPLGDTWIWDGSAWKQQQALTMSPPARQRAAMAYDGVNRLVILFAGTGTTETLDDTWAWDGSAWQQLHPAHSPPARDGAAATYDPAIGAVVLFGGMSHATAPPSALHDTWSWNGGDWTPIDASGPAGGAGPRTAFLPGANLVARFGDCAESHDNTIYGFDGHTWVPKTTAGPSPPALCLPGLAGDPVRHLIVLFGGNPGTGGSPVPAETWSYDGNGWTKGSPKQSPPARYDAPMVYDSGRNVTVLFGGQGLAQGQGGPLNDTWTWDGSNWTPHQ